MDDEQQNEHNTLLAWILGIAITIAIAVSVIVGIVGAIGTGTGTGTGAGKASTAGAADAAATAEVDVAPPVATGPGFPAPARLHFDTGKSDLPADSAAQLAPIADWANADPAARIGVSGFHDSHGDPAANAVLARNRAVAARDALVAAGVPAERIVMVKPQETTGGSDDREARRVDVYPAQ